MTGASRLAGLILASGALLGSAPGRCAAAVPDSLAAVAESAEDVYDLAKENSWSKAADKLDPLQAAVKRLVFDVRLGEPTRKLLDENLSSLGIAVKSRDRSKAMLQANQTTKLAADLSESFHPQVPAAVARLDYYGRELEVWSAAKDKSRLRLTKDAMLKEWGGLRSAVESRDRKTAGRFSALIARLRSAQSAEDYGRLAAPILDAVDELEAAFKK